MKVVAFNGSPRKDGNTQAMIEEAFKHLRAKGVECERIDIAKKALRGCLACNGCKKTGVCVIADELNDWFLKALEADAILIGSPVYFANVSAETKAFIDRIGKLSRVDNRFKRKPMAAIVAQRRGGALPTYDAINRFGQINQMIMVGSTYWNFGMGYEKGAVEEDQEAKANMENLAENLYWLMEKIEKD